MSVEDDEATQYRRHRQTQARNNIEGNSVAAKMSKNRIKKHAEQWKSAEEVVDFFRDRDASLRTLEGYDPTKETHAHLQILERLFGYLRWYYDEMGGAGMGHCKIIFQSLKVSHDRLCIRVLNTEPTLPDFFSHMQPRQGKRTIDSFEKVILNYRKHLIEATTRVATVKSVGVLGHKQKKANNRLFFSLLDEINRFNVIATYFTKRIGLSFSFEQIETTKIDWPTKSVWHEIAKINEKKK